MPDARNLRTVSGICASCKHWRPHSSYIRGRCEARAPVGVLRLHPQGNGEQYLDTQWPSTKPDEGCGDWAAQAES